ncbi:uncharacterized protein LOC123674585 [Harmonia axyridis]|uniref:uncharacterized protein LOC123674585 n=1 Tax=Harmonia axyridis TaxID=115357 RepID=UPI001E276E27|nr:uncharacterized protein LOC123674585 [Harmonia axyridis]
MSTELVIDYPDRIERFFEGKTVFVSGGTGFLGKVLIEKLLRACPKIENIVTLVRVKKGKSPEQRIEEMLSGPLFDSVRQKGGPDQLKKVIAIKGDVIKTGLDLCREDRTWLCEEVNVVFHCAATVRFDEPLRRAVLLNVRGTKQMLDLAKEMRKLQVFQHVSTAYCHMEEAELFEKAYDPPADPHHIIKICEWLRQEDIELISPRLLGRSPNTYAYTKALAEALVVEQMPNLPLQILRPSVVVPIWKEPIPGWTDSINGPAGLLIGAGKGVIRTMYMKGDACADYVSVDLVVNALIFVAFLTSLNIEKRIFHITSNNEVRITYDDLINRGKKIVQTKLPLPGSAWYPGGSTKRSRLYNNFCIFFYHLVPAMIVDTILYIIGYEPVLMRVQKRVAKGFEVLEYYANNQWTFNNRESLELRKFMNPLEKEKYRLDTEGFDFQEYLENCVISIRRHMLNEPDETLPASRRHMMILTKYIGKMSTDLLSDHPDRIEKLFEGKTVFITGGTGFLGKVVIEKLLRLCPKVKQITTLVRIKKGKSPEQRLKEILEGPLFDSVRQKWGPEHLKKVIAIKGNLIKDRLDICEKDRTWLCEEVQIVFHMAATVRFDMTLKSAALMNVKGTKEVLDLAKEMKNLQIFQHISTAYCHLEEKELFEKAYEPPSNPHHIIKLCEWLEEEDIELITPKLIGRSPNTYAYTKALSEALVVEQMNNLPVVIVRPSVVVPIWEEPIPGWTDNFNGPAGLLTGAGKGVLRTMYIKENSCSDYIPVDIVASAMLAITLFASLNANEKIYHVTSNQEVKISYDELIEKGKKMLETKIPFSGVAWYPGGSIKRSKLYNKLCFFLYQLIPAIIVDTILSIIGYEPVLMRVQRRIAKGCDVLEYYANNEWIFHNRNILENRKLLNPTERKKYKLDKDGFELEKFLVNCIISIRRYMLNEPDETIAAAKRHMMILWVLDRFTKILCFLVFLYLLYKHLYLRMFI